MDKVISCLFAVTTFLLFTTGEVFKGKQKTTHTTGTRLCVLPAADTGFTVKALI